MSVVPASVVSALTSLRSTLYSVGLKAPWQVRKTIMNR
jgi:hypothetical protein